MATNSNISGYPPPYGIQSGAPFPQQQPVYTAMYPPVQMGYPQHPVYYPQYQQQPMIPNSNINIFPHDAILFYDEDKLYYELSNFAKFGFDLDGVNWPTSEHYFQAQKFEGNPQIISQVRRLPGPRDAFEFVRRADNRALIRKDWPTKKDEIMYEALKAKFTQNKDLKKLLLDTNDRILVEDSPHDPYWGIGKDKKGQNKLGELLMKLRTELRRHPSTNITPLATRVSTMEPRIELKRCSSSHLNSLHSTLHSDRIEYDANDSSHFLSNCFGAVFHLDGNEWPTVLHYFVAKKFNLKPKHVNTILTMRSSRDVHLYSRNSMHKQDIDYLWDPNKKSIMKEALRAKFLQNIDLKQKLLDTRDREIVEISQDDSYWSQLADGIGRNIMGMLLSQVRLELKSCSITQNAHIPITPIISSFKQDSSSQAALTSTNGNLLKRRQNMPTASNPITNQTRELIYRSPKSSPSKQDSAMNTLSADLSRTKLTNSIHFSDPDPLVEYCELSTFYVNTFKLDGQYWSSVQHYFQAQKYATGTAQWLMDKIRTASSPNQAYELGTDRRNSRLMVICWDYKREGVMLKALRAKFCDAKLKRILQGTADRHLVHDSKEEFWGTGRVGNGKNKLGQLLVEIRKELTENNSPSKCSYKYSQLNSSYLHKGTNEFTQPSPNSLSSHNDVIRFYEEYKLYYEFTPYSKHSVTVDGIKWRTLNHYFQAQKFTDQKYRDTIMNTTTPQRATYLAKSAVNNKFEKPLTSFEKESIMKKGLTAKLTQHPDVLQSLISTGTKHILFVHPTDIVWGTGSDMEGWNRLGELLMELRTELKNTSSSKATDHLFSSDEEGRGKNIINRSQHRKILLPPNSQAFFRTKLFFPVLTIMLLIISTIILQYCFR